MTPPTCAPARSYTSKFPARARWPEALPLLTGLPQLHIPWNKEAPVRAKKTKTPARSIRYLLYADRRLRKISLRRISARLTRANRTPKPARAKNAARSKVILGSPWAMGTAAATMCVITAAVLLASRESSPAAEFTPADVQLEPASPAAPGLPNQPARTRLDTKTPAAPDTRRPVTPPVVKSTTTLFPAPAVESESTGRGAITITGCLERDGQRYWLKDTTGADVQASRSWKSGFMKKRSPRFEVVDATKTLKLTNHVGARVATTGTLSDREMQARSLRRLAASCS